MADLKGSLEGVANSLPMVSAQSGKYLLVHDENGTLVGRMRPELILNPVGLVDLGLPSGLLWSKCNVGANRENGYGLYFSWGNVHGYKEGSGYDFSQQVYEQTEGYSINTDLTLENDMAHAYLGGKYRLPSAAEFQELYDNTNKTWTSIGGVNGYKFANKSNANLYIFIPAGGYYDGSTLTNRGSSGNYWSLTYETSSRALNFYFTNNSTIPQNTYLRRGGFPIRAVV